MMIKGKRFIKSIAIDEEVPAQISEYCNKNGITKEMIIYCNIYTAPNGVINGNIVYEVE